eukprot:TRINITY_DN2443_c0_g1_i1.p1 TRINITY_DN2443_c0_g1~~TRINITY_DN2443_c0_g1_i1.p1  ORF type:complete len:285 (-),score=54.29 TRINITY_DN2443_c0_g1_i1:48-902(-)
MINRALSRLKRFERRSRKRERFNILKNYDKDAQDVKLDQDGVEWAEDKDYEICTTLKIHGINVPEKYHHWAEDPFSFKTQRDKRLIQRIQKWQKRDRLRKVRNKETTNEPSKRQLQVSHSIKEALNEILSEEITSIPDPTNTSKTFIMAPIFQSASVRIEEVQVTKDLTRATCVWECLPDFELQVRDQLSSLKTAIRQRLAEKIIIKFMPKLEFTYNEKRVQRQNIERLLDAIEHNLPDGHSAVTAGIAFESPSSLEPKQKEDYMKKVLLDFAKRNGISPNEEF